MPNGMYDESSYSSLLSSQLQYINEIMSRKDELVSIVATCEEGYAQLQEQLQMLQRQEQICDMCASMHQDLIKTIDRTEQHLSKIVNYKRQLSDFKDNFYIEEEELKSIAQASITSQQFKLQLSAMKKILSHPMFGQLYSQFITQQDADRPANNFVVNTLGVIEVKCEQIFKFFESKFHTTINYKPTFEDIFQYEDLYTFLKKFVMATTGDESINLTQQYQQLLQDIFGSFCSRLKKYSKISFGCAYPLHMLQNQGQFADMNVFMPIIRVQGSKIKQKYVVEKDAYKVVRCWFSETSPSPLPSAIEYFRQLMNQLNITEEKACDCYVNSVFFNVKHNNRQIYPDEVHLQELQRISYYQQKQVKITSNNLQYKYHAEHVLRYVIVLAHRFIAESVRFNRVFCPQKGGAGALNGQIGALVAKLGKYCKAIANELDIVGCASFIRQGRQLMVETANEDVQLVIKQTQNIAISKFYLFYRQIYGNIVRLDTDQLDGIEGYLSQYLADVQVDGRQGNTQADGYAQGLLQEFIIKRESKVSLDYDAIYTFCFRCGLLRHMLGILQASCLGMLKEHFTTTLKSYLASQLQRLLGDKEEVLQRLQTLIDDTIRLVSCQ